MNDKVGMKKKRNELTIWVWWLISSREISGDVFHIQNCMIYVLIMNLSFLFSSQ